MKAKKNEEREDEEEEVEEKSERMEGSVRDVVNVKNIFQLMMEVSASLLPTLYTHTFYCIVSSIIHFIPFFCRRRRCRKKIVMIFSMLHGNSR